MLDGVTLGTITLSIGAFLTANKGLVWLLMGLIGTLISFLTFKHISTEKDRFYLRTPMFILGYILGIWLGLFTLVVGATFALVILDIDRRDAKAAKAVTKAIKAKERKERREIKRAARKAWWIKIMTTPIGGK